MSQRALGRQFPKKYTVVTEHEGGAVKREHFDVAEDADDYAMAHTPDTDGTMMPNVSDAVMQAHQKKGLEYDRGHFWMRTNRHAVIFSDPSKPSRYRDSE